MFVMVFVLLSFSLIVDTGKPLLLYFLTALIPFEHRDQKARKGAGGAFEGFPCLVLCQICRRCSFSQTKLKDTREKKATCAIERAKRRESKRVEGHCSDRYPRSI